MMTADFRIRPLADRVVIKPVDREEQTKGGIYLPDTASKERPMEGTVLAVGGRGGSVPRRPRQASRHCEERSDEAISTSRSPRGLRPLAMTGIGCPRGLERE